MKNDPISKPWRIAICRFMTVAHCAFWIGWALTYVNKTVSASQGGGTYGWTPVWGISAMVLFGAMWGYEWGKAKGQSE